LKRPGGWRRAYLRAETFSFSPVACFEQITVEFVNRSFLREV